MMKLRFAAIAAAAGLLILAPDVRAHHSFAAEFDGKKPVRLVGKLTRLEWTNPHSYFYLDVEGDNGKVSSWTCEAGGPMSLSRRGLSKGDVKVGDVLVVDGYLAKDGSRMIDARRVTLPDGRSINGGSPGDGAPGSDDPTDKKKQ
jgi:hypothetical protein